MSYMKTIILMVFIVLMMAGCSQYPNTVLIQQLGTSGPLSSQISGLGIYTKGVARVEYYDGKPIRIIVGEEKQ